MNATFGTGDLRPDREAPRVERFARRLRMTEGQLYTIVLVFLGVLLLLASGLPGSGETPSIAPTGIATTEAP